MKKVLGSVVVIGLLFCLASPAFADKKVRKLPVSAYLKSAKIHILSGKLERYEAALAMLDSLFMYYGHHAEGLHWVGQIMVDYIEKAPSPSAKAPYVEKMVAYFDSLTACCENKKIKEKYKSDCDKYVNGADSIAVKYWREFYNAGIDQLNTMDDLANDLQAASDSAIIAYIQTGIDANFDSCVANMQLALVIDPSDHKAYIALGSAYQKHGDFDKAIEWKTKGLEKTKDRSSLLVSIAYDYINQDKYCEAIPFLAEYVEGAPEDTVSMYNLSICYNNCQMYDSALVVYYRILALNPENVDVLGGVGRYYNEMGRRASDSAKYYKEQNSNKVAEQWQAKKDADFDSSLFYFRKAFDLNPDDEFVAEMYALISAINQDFENAVTAFSKLTELQPANPDNWISLGDCQLSMKQFDESIAAYEKAVELQPGNAQIWQQLADLYKQVGNKTKETEANKQLEKLK